MDNKDQEFVLSIDSWSDLTLAFLKMVFIKMITQVTSSLVRAYLISIELLAKSTDSWNSISIKLQFLSVALNAWRMERELCH